jgi:hypothetical protein
VERALFARDALHDEPRAPVNKYAQRSCSSDRVFISLFEGGV